MPTGSAAPAPADCAHTSERKACAAALLRAEPNSAPADSARCLRQAKLSSRPQRPFRALRAQRARRLLRAKELTHKRVAAARRLNSLASREPPRRRRLACAAAAADNCATQSLSRVASQRSSHWRRQLSRAAAAPPRRDSVRLCAAAAPPGNAQRQTQSARVLRANCVGTWPRRTAICSAATCDARNTWRLRNAPAGRVRAGGGRIPAARASWLRRAPKECGARYLSRHRKGPQKRRRPAGRHLPGGDRCKRGRQTSARCNLWNAARRDRFTIVMVRRGARCARQLAPTTSARDDTQQSI